jgi:hypothetical protein
MTAYFRATRHPWASWLFVAPLLLAYELGVHHLSQGNPDSLRNGADVWARARLAEFGLPILWAAPAILLGGLLLMAWWRWPDRPQDPFGTIFGMAIESLVFAVGIWALSRNFRSLMDQSGIPLASVPFHPLPLGQVVNYIGAGVYEEVLFRLGLFTVIALILRAVMLPGLIAMLVAAVLASLAFSAAHHIGPAGEPMVPIVFYFRTAAGLVFSALYITRGLGIAVGAHAGYNILVGSSVA